MGDVEHRGKRNLGAHAPPSEYCHSVAVPGDLGGLPHVVTTEEIGRIALFASLDAAETERHRVAADISLVAGEDAAPGH